MNRERSRRSALKRKADKLLHAAVFERDRGICQRCGATAHDAAHLIPRSRAPFLHWDVENVVALCRTCHQMLDGAPSLRFDWAYSRWPARMERLVAKQVNAERWGLHVDLDEVIAGFRGDLTAAESTAYREGTW